METMRIRDARRLAASGADEALLWGARDALLRQRAIGWGGVPAVALAIVVTAGLSVYLFPLGFQGWDDFEYLRAAERWLAEGVHAGANHWANRLPYVLAFAGAFKLFGVSEAALIALHTVLFAAVGLVAWGLARTAFGQDQRGERAALLSLGAVLATPLFFRLPTTFYPEALELALAGLCVLLSFWWNEEKGQQRPGWWLVLAGVLGGFAVLVRQTAIALPLALGALLLADGTRPLAARIRAVAWLASGFVLVQAAEIAFHLLLTGDPLHRLHVDARHVEIPSIHMAGGAYHADGRVLFNWQLAARWKVPSTVEAHWSLMPLVRLMTSPGLLVIPWLALAGGVLAWRAGGAARRFALIAGLVLLLHYVINTFVLVIAPNTRYLGVALLLLCPLAGYALAALPWRAALACFLALLVVPTLVVASLQPRPSSQVEGLKRLLPAANGEPIHLPRPVAAVAALRLREDLGLSARISLASAAPVGGLAVGGHYAWPEGAPDGSCSDGGPAWDRVATTPPDSPVWDAVRAAGLAPLVPPGMARVLGREQDAFHLLRRRC
jgi:Dolichyl-phosphate-mannose-protein mannosyltransferase